MIIKRVMPAVISVLLASLILVYVSFQTNRSGTGGPVWEGQTINVLSCYEIREQQDILREFADEFHEQNPKLRVELEFIDKENLKKDICLRADDGDKPDLVICDSSEMAGLLDMDVLEEITPLITRERRERVIWPDMWQSVMDDGRYYGLPFTCDPYVLFYNTDYFRKKSLQVPERWDQVFEICNSMDSSGIYGLETAARRTGDAARLFNYILHVCGGNYYNLDSGQGIRTLKILDALKRWGYMDKNVINYTHKDVARDFAEKRAAMMIAPVSMKMYLDQLECRTEYGISVFPGATKPGYVLSGDNIGILKNAHEGAYCFLEFLYGPQVRTRFIAATGTLPVFRTEAGANDRESDMQKLEQGFLEHGVTLKSYNSWFEISSILSQYVSDMLTRKNTDLSESARMLQDEVKVAIMNH